jgi:hypothetical protein
MFKYHQKTLGRQITDITTMYSGIVSPVAITHDIAAAEMLCAEFGDKLRPVVCKLAEGKKSYNWIGK